jgi:hypothetical protein
VVFDPFQEYSGYKATLKSIGRTDTRIPYFEPLLVCRRVPSFSRFPLVHTHTHTHTYTVILPSSLMHGGVASGALVGYYHQNGTIQIRLFARVCQCVCLHCIVWFASTLCCPSTCQSLTSLDLSDAFASLINIHAARKLWSVLNSSIVVFQQVGVVHNSHAYPNSHHSPTHTTHTHTHTHTCTHSHTHSHSLTPNHTRHILPQATFQFSVDSSLRRALQQLSCVMDAEEANHKSAELEKAASAKKLKKKGKK